MNKIIKGVFIGIGFGLCLGCKNSPETRQQDTGFTYLPSSETGVKFENRLTNSNDFNIIQYLYFYNGGGVAVGDINNDGLTDLYFSSNQEANKLYLNKGDFSFEDITEKSGAAGYGNWKTGVTMADVNGDGLLDIYLCGVGKYKGFFGYNQLYVNNGNLTFTERAQEYGLAFQGFSTQSAFFDYDNDGDLDMYLLNHSVHSVRSYGSVMLRNESDPLAGDRLFRNNLVPSGKTHFEEVTAKAGIFSSQVGYGLGIGVSDLNNDGYADIYVSNDFHENDYMYINNGDGTFRQVLEKAMTHTSRFSMGNDIADINEDGWNDIVTLDMFPSDERVIKTTAGEDNYEIFQYKLRFGYHHQMSRNAMQINLGPVDSAGGLLFSDVAPMAGVAATDWSWSTLLADFDNDGLKDMFVTNGIVGRPNDLDYINYISNDSAQRHISDEQLFSKMPPGDVPNVMYRKENGFRFTDVSKQWIGDVPTVSNGAAYADLDNDGDLDLAVNNINAQAFIMRNDVAVVEANYLKVKFEGPAENTFGLGASVRIYTGNDSYYREQNVTRGWLSSVDYTMHVGIGYHMTIDSVRVIWPGGKTEVHYNVPADTNLQFKFSDASDQWSYVRPVVQPLLEQTNLIPWKHEENDFNVLESQRLIPHMNSTRGPCMAVGDMNGDRLDDLFIGGGQKQPAAIFIQTAKGKFVLKPQPEIEKDKDCEDTAAALFDVDGDRDLDLMVGGGGEQFLDRRIMLRLYINNGKGVFTKVVDKDKLQKIYVNATCIVPADVDNDKDMDVFVGGGVITGKYGLNDYSFILVNDGKGNLKETPSVFDKNQRPTGIVQSAAWADFNNDGFLELVVTGEWMPLQFWVNHNGVLKLDGKNEYYGWWNNVITTDFEGDGDWDLVGGNYGWNSRLQLPVNDSSGMRYSDKQFISMLVSDLDGNSSLDQVLTYERDDIRYPVLSRDQFIRQVPSLKKKYLKYTDYARATARDIVTNNKFTESKVTTFSSVALETKNPEIGIMSSEELPEEAQAFPIYAIHATDLNGDGIKDLILGGNQHSVQPELWRQDAGYGLVLLSNKQPTNQRFYAITATQSGFVVKGEVRSIQSLTLANKEQLILVGRNNDSLMVFKKKIK